MRSDCHIHMVLDGFDFRAAIASHKEAPNLPFIHKTLASYRDRGYTYLRDGGDRFGACYVARDLAGEYGIIYRAPGAPLYQKGHYGSFIGTGFADLREFAALVQKKHDEKADFLKIMISGLMDFNHFGKLSEAGLDPKTIRQMVHIGKEEGFSVMAHANGPETVLAAVEAGADSIEHGAYLGEEALSAMAENRCVWVPTLSPVANLLGSGRFPDREVRPLVDSFVENLNLFASMSGIIACGSDAGAWRVPHDANTEVSLLENALGSACAEILRRGNAEIQRRF